MNTQVITPTYTTIKAERRVSLLVRNRFDSALTLLKPLFSKPDAFNGTSLYRAMNQLHQAYPDLSGHEIEALVAAVVRTLQKRNGNAG